MPNTKRKQPNAKKTEKKDHERGLAKGHEYATQVATLDDLNVLAAAFRGGNEKAWAAYGDSVMAALEGPLSDGVNAKLRQSGQFQVGVGMGAIAALDDFCEQYMADRPDPTKFLGEEPNETIRLHSPSSRAKNPNRRT